MASRFVELMLHGTPATGAELEHARLVKFLARDVPPTEPRGAGGGAKGEK